MGYDFLPRPNPHSFLKTDLFVAWRGTDAKLLVCMSKLIAAQVEARCAGNTKDRWEQK
jgi:hypothetical protein